MVQTPNRVYEYFLIMHERGAWNRRWGYVKMAIHEKPEVRDNFVYLRNTRVCPLSELWYIQIGDRVFYQEDI